MDRADGGIDGGRCPFAGEGLSSERMRACAGFAQTQVSFIGVEVPGAYRGKAWPEGFSCAHLRAAASLRGWRGVCGHPDGIPTGWTNPTPVASTA